MPQRQDRSLDFFTCSPAHYHNVKAAPNVDMLLNSLVHQNLLHIMWLYIKLTNPCYRRSSSYVFAINWSKKNNSTVVFFHNLQMVLKVNSGTGRVLQFVDTSVTLASRKNYVITMQVGTTTKGFSHTGDFPTADTHYIVLTYRVPDVLRVYVDGVMYTHTGSSEYVLKGYCIDWSVIPVFLPLSENS